MTRPWIWNDRGFSRRQASEDQHGSVVCVAVSAADGKTLAELRLDALPVWDGLIAAENRLYVSLADGSVVCLAEAK